MVLHWVKMVKNHIQLRLLAIFFPTKPNHGHPFCQAGPRPMLPAVERTVPSHRLWKHGFARHGFGTPNPPAAGKEKDKIKMTKRFHPFQVVPKKSTNPAKKPVLFLRQRKDTFFVGRQRYRDLK